MSKSLGQTCPTVVCSCFILVLFYFGSKNEDHVSNKSPVLSLIRFIRHYMLFLSSFPGMPRHVLQTLFCRNILVIGFEEDKKSLINSLFILTKSLFLMLFGKQLLGNLKLDCAVENRKRG